VIWPEEGYCTIQ